MSKSSKYLLDNIQPTLNEIMLEFVRSSIWDRPPRISSKSIIDWDRLLEASVGQELTALVWDGIEHMKSNSLLSRQQLISFGLSAQEVWERYNMCKKALDSIMSVCQENQMKLLLLKGIGLSFLYPKPETRFCKDIDIYLFDDYEKGNELLAHNKYVWQGKHSIFSFKGITVENHSFFFQLGTRKKRMFNGYMESSLKDVILTKHGFYILSPEANLIFLTLHALKHCSKERLIPYKNIVDFGLFLYHNKENLQPESCRLTLRKLKILKGYEILLCLAEDFLQVEFEDYHFSRFPEWRMRSIKKIFLEDYPFLKNKKKKLLENQVAFRYLMRYIPNNVGFKTLLHIRLIKLSEKIRKNRKAMG